MGPSLLFAQEVEMARLRTLRLEAQEGARLHASRRTRPNGQRSVGHRDEGATTQDAFWKLIRI